MYYIFDSDYFIRTLRIHTSRSPGHAIENLAQFHLINETSKLPDTFKLSGSYHPESPTTGGDEALELASQWLELCICNHECCGRD